MKKSRFWFKKAKRMQMQAEYRQKKAAIYGVVHMDNTINKLTIVMCLHVQTITEACSLPLGLNPVLSDVLQMFQCSNCAHLL